LAAHHAASPRPVRRGGAVAAAVALAGVALVTLARQDARLRALELADAVGAWHASPELVLRALPSASAAAALLFLALSFAGLAWNGRVGLRTAYVGALGALLVALLAAGVTPLPEHAPATPFDAPPRDRLVPPALALVILLVATAILMRRGDDGGWWLPSRGAAAAMARSLLPAVILFPPTVAWLLDLLERRGAIGAEESLGLLPALLVLLLGAAMAIAAHRLRRGESRDRDRDARRLRRLAEREAEHAASRAEATLRVASDHYRTHLRTILDVAPSPFLAVDRTGQVSYANAAATALLGRAFEEVVGHPIEHAWPTLGAAVQQTLATAPGGAPIERTLTDPQSGRHYELRGFPGEEGAAVFLREV
ncbi:MAG TPA: PAS domain-containing protein, partial [Gemmatimonadales bacterium]